MHAGADEGMGSMKNQFKKADASGARYALIFGSDELAQGNVAVKALRTPILPIDAVAGAALGTQSLYPLNKVHDLALKLKS